MERIISGILLVYLILFPFGQLTRVPLLLFGSPEIHLYLADIFLGLLLFFWFGWRLVSRRENYSLPNLTLPVLIFISVGLVSLFTNSGWLSDREMIVAGLYLLRWAGYAGFFFVLVDLKERFTWLKGEKIKRILMTLGIIVAIFGFVQYFLWPNLEPLEELGWDPHYYRVVSTFLDPGYTGLILVLTLILMVNFWLARENKKENSGFFLIALLVYLALALTYSRASYLAFLVGMGTLAYSKKLPFLFVSAVLLGIGTVIILPRPSGEGGKLGRTYSIQARIENWQQAISIARSHPILGVGFDAYRYAQQKAGYLADEDWQTNHAGAGADSSLLLVLATMGVVGFLAYLWLWLKIFSSKSSAILASLTAIFSHAFFLNSLFYPWIMAWLWILIASESS
jgi:hypothetical protein